MAEATCCVLHCAASATDGTAVSNGQVNGLPIKLFLKSDHSGKMCAAHVEANREQASHPGAHISLASTLGAKPAAGKMPMLMRARAGGQLPRQGSLDLPPKEPGIPVVTRSESSPMVGAPLAKGAAKMPTSGLRSGSGSVEPVDATSSGSATPQPASQQSPRPSLKKAAATPTPASPRSGPGPRPNTPQPMNPLTSSGKNIASSVSAPAPTAVVPRGSTPPVIPASTSGSSSSLTSAPASDPPPTVAAPLSNSGKGTAAKYVPAVRAVGSSSSRPPTPSAGTASSLGDPPPTATSKSAPAKSANAKSKAVEDAAAATADLHSLATDKSRTRPFLDQLDSNPSFREKMIGDLKKGAELKRVGEKGALTKLHLRISDDGDFLVVNGKTHLPLAELDEVRLGQLNDNFAKNAAKLRTFASNSFSYVFLRGESIDVIAGSDVEFQLWSVGLRKLFDRKRDRLLSALAEPWMECIGSREEKASTKDMATILAKFNCNTTALALREKLGLDENVKLSFDEFVYHFRRVLRARPEVEQLFMKYSSNKILLRPDELLSFLREDQQETTATLETAQALIRKYRLLNSDGDRIEAGRRDAAKNKQEAESKERQARIDAKLEDRKKGLEQRRLEKQASQDTQPQRIGLTPEQEFLSTEEKVKLLDAQLKQLVAAIISKENTHEGLERLVSFYASDISAQEQARKEAGQLLASLTQMRTQRTALERKLNNLRGGHDTSGATDKGGEGEDKRQAVARQVKELEDSIAAKQRSLAGLERLIAGYASDPAAQSRVRKEVADGRAEIARLIDAKQKLDRTTVELLARGSSAIDARDTAGRRAEVEEKHKEVRAELKSRLVSRRALVKMVQVYAADPPAQARVNKQLSDETAKLADLLEVRRLLERQLQEMGCAVAQEDPEVDSELERLLGGDGAPRAGERNLSASQVNTLLENATAAALSTGKGKENELGMTLADFIDLMEGEENSALAPEMAKLHQDMTRPLCEYWIASSHNTYLTGDQFQSDSSVEMYVKVLKSGCRCIEIDIWDGPDGEPIVYHGHTLTSKITFRDVCRAVGEYAFVASPYPLILSFENHCSLKQQQRMAEIIRACFKNHLAVAVADTTVLPSPEELKERILIKGKTNSAGAEQEDEGDQINAEEQADRKASASSTSATGAMATIGGNASLQGSTDSIVSSAAADRAKYATTTHPLSGKKMPARAAMAKEPKKIEAKDKDADTGEEKVSTTPDTMHPALSDITYLRARRFVSFEAAQTGPPKCECSSFGEQRFMRLLQTSAGQFAELNKRALSRTYPKGTRMDSSNYSPAPCWNAGIQLVAINYQTPGRPMWLNQGRFAVNGGTGYVLKPDLLRTGSFDPNSATQRIGKYARLEVVLLSALQLPVGCSDPVAILSVTGLDADNKEYKSKVVKGNGFNPSWNERYFFTLQGSELAIFMICIETEAMTGDQRVAQVAFPVEALRPGYRVFPLYDREGRLIPQSSILCKISLRRPDELKTL